MLSSKTVYQLTANGLPDTGRERECCALCACFWPMGEAYAGLCLADKTSGFELDDLERCYVNDSEREGADCAAFERFTKRNWKGRNHYGC